MSRCNRSTIDSAGVVFTVVPKPCSKKKYRPLIKKVRKPLFMHLSYSLNPRDELLTLNIDQALCLQNFYKFVLLAPYKKSHKKRRK